MFYIINRTKSNPTPGFSASPKRRLKAETSNVSVHFIFTHVHESWELGLICHTHSVVLSTLRFLLTAYRLPANEKLAFISFPLLSWESWLTTWFWGMLTTLRFGIDKNNNVNKDVYWTVTLPDNIQSWNSITSFHLPSHYELLLRFPFHR